MSLSLVRSGMRVIAAAGEEFRIQIGVGQPEILQIEHIGLGALLQARADPDWRSNGRDSRKPE